MEKLKVPLEKCPFCGVYPRYTNGRTPLGTEYHTIFCNGRKSDRHTCDATGNTLNRAVKIWNRRQAEKE